MGVAAGLAWVGVRCLGRLAGEVEGDLCGFDFAGVGVAGQLGDTKVIDVASLVFHEGEDTDGVLAEDGVEGDEGLEDGAPLELVEATHAVERR